MQKLYRISPEYDTFEVAALNAKDNVEFWSKFQFVGYVNLNDSDDK